MYGSRYLRTAKYQKKEAIKVTLVRGNISEQAGTTGSQGPKTKTKHPNLYITRYNPIIDNIMDVEGQNIVKRSIRWSQGGSWCPLGIGGHGEKNRYKRVNRQVSNLARSLVQWKRRHPDKAISIEAESCFRRIIDRN